MTVNLHWYGERGIVNSLITHVAGLGVKGVQELLDRIEWGDPSQNEWIRNLESVEILVEIGLAQFGDPDLIFVCLTNSGEFYTIIMEVKATTYLASATQGGRSRIQRQLMLKYRFARASDHLKYAKSEGILQEPDELHSQYQEFALNEGWESETEKPRKLLSSRVISLLKKSGLMNTDLKNFRFVAWTWDREPYFISEGVHTDPTRPLFLNDDGTEDWGYTKSKLGWLGYKAVEKLVGRKNNAYKSARETMLATTEPVEVRQYENARHLIPQNIEKTFSLDLKNKLQELRESACEYFSKEQVRSLSGSISVTPHSYKASGSKVLLKIIPHKEYNEESIVLGVSVVFAEEKWADKSHDGLVKFSGQYFFAYTLFEDEKNLPFACRVFEEVHEKLNSDEEDE